MRHRLALLSSGIAVIALGVSVYLAYGRKSLAQVSNAKLILYWEPDFQGPSLEVTGTLPDMPVITDDRGAQFDWNDQVRSLVVLSGTWRLHQNGRLNTRLDETPLALLDLVTKERVEGWSCLVSATSRGPLYLPTGAAGGFAYDISSIELVSEDNLADWALPIR
jgi:hypothetical protein